ncbi:MAG TPA: Ig-like domain-containing protein [Gemmatimonadaceae bacterium]|nr:Ig-like domain-containing protein [Gemmatimonadaceae bacterium]
MRRLIAAAAAALIAAACAQPGFPPGGPQEKVPPKLLSVKPESGAVNVHPDEVSLQFDEVLNEQAGGADLNKNVIISPQLGEPDVGWHRTRLTVRGEGDFKPNTAYTITVFPGLADLRGNVRKEPVVTVFSTGASIPSSHVSGIVFDWVAGRPLASAWAQAISIADTNVVYLARADSAGRFTIPHVPPGAYRVRAFGDANNDRLIDLREPWDTAGVSLRDSSRVELLAFIHDTIGPRISQVTPTDSVTFRVRFDKPLEPSARIDTSLFALKASDSSAVPIRLAQSAIVWDSTHGGAAPPSDSADSARAADSVRTADSLRTAAQRQAPGNVARDTAQRAPAPKPSKPSPTTDVVIVTAAPLDTGASYRIEWHDVKNLLGKASTGSFLFTVQKPGAMAPPGGAPPGAARPVPGDTSRAAPADTSRRAPADTSRRAPPDTSRAVPPDTSRRVTRR